MSTEWDGPLSDDPAELRGFDWEPPWPDKPDAVELAALQRDLEEEERRWAQ